MIAFTLESLTVTVIPTIFGSLLSEMMILFVPATNFCDMSLFATFVTLSVFNGSFTLIMILSGQCLLGSFLLVFATLLDCKVVNSPLEAFIGHESYFDNNIKALVKARRNKRCFSESGIV